jgi:hypothetical protein
LGLGGCQQIDVVLQSQTCSAMGGGISSRESTITTKTDFSGSDPYSKILHGMAI